jgi:hypothetical protein
LCHSNPDQPKFPPGLVSRSPFEPKPPSFHERVLQIGFALVEKPGRRRAIGLSSPSRHI